MTKHEHAGPMPDAESIAINQRDSAYSHDQEGDRRNALPMR